MAAQILTVVCAWCHRTVKQGQAGAPITHTICPSCVEWTMTRVLSGDLMADGDSDVGRLIPPPGYFGDAG